MTSKGKVIVIDGLDGSGKSTQYEIVINELKNRVIKFKAVSFPQYESNSSALVKMYLAGEFAKDPSKINCYAASSFYAVDRYASFKTDWEKNYNNGEVILASRYISSNAIHQMEKLEYNQWDFFIEWLFDYECNKLGLPNEDKVIFLDVPVYMSQELLNKRYLGNEKRKDIHENNISYLEKCREAALYAAKKLNWNVVKCYENNSMLSVNSINKLIMSIIDEVI